MAATIERIKELSLETMVLFPDLFHRDSLVWFPSGWDDNNFQGLVRLIETISKKYLVPNDSVFVDLGSGDGLVVFLASLFGFQSYGIELRRDLDSLAREYKNRLQLNGQVHLLRGDWENLPTFQDAGIEFTDANFFYIYPSSYQGLQKAFDMVSVLSPSGTILAVKWYQLLHMTRVPTELEKIGEIECPTSNILIYRKI